MILVFIEHRDCVLNKTSLEAITAAQGIGKDLGLKVSAVIPCDKDCALAQEIAGYDLEKVIVAKNEKLGIYTPDGYADAWEQVIKADEPAVRRYVAHLSGARFCAEGRGPARQGSRRRLYSL